MEIHNWKKYEDTLQVGMAINSLKSVLFVKRVALSKTLGILKI
jgi:hypothetical protein